MPIWPKRKKRVGVDEYGRSDLWNAAFEGDFDLVKKILSTNVDPNSGDDTGLTPLHMAIQQKHVNVIHLLLDSGADINQPDKNGNIPLWTAIHNWRQELDVILLLLEHGADPTIKNHHGNAVMAVLENSNSLEVKPYIQKWEQTNESAITLRP